MDAVLPQVRRIAVLVTSLDAAAGRQLLSAMPAQLARQVRQAMASMTRIDPEEQRRVLAEFRSQAMAGESANAAHPANAPAHNSSADFSTAASAGAKDKSPAARSSFEALRADGWPPATPSADSYGGQARPASAGAPHGDYSGQSASRSADGQPGSQWNTGSQSPLHNNQGNNQANTHPSFTNDQGHSWQQLEPDAMAHLLLGERATVVAVVLNQLAPPQAVALIEKFPVERRNEIITRLARLRDIDREAMQTIDEHLASRIADYHHQRASDGESVGRMQALLSAASPELRDQLQSSILSADASLAKQLGIVGRTSAASELSALGSSNSRVGGDVASKVEMAEPVTAQKPSRQTPTGREDVWAEFGSSVIATVDSEPSQSGLNADQSDEPDVLPFPTKTAREDRRTTISFEQILDLSAEDIGQVLSDVDGEVLLLALAGATPNFMKRFNAMLSRADSRALQQRLRGIGPINLQDVDEAQRRLASTATELLERKIALTKANARQAA